MKKGLEGKLTAWLSELKPGKSFTTEEAMKGASGWPRTSYSSAIARLIEKGYVERVGVSVFRVTGALRKAGTKRKGSAEVVEVEGRLLAVYEDTLYELVEV